MIAVSTRSPVGCVALCLCILGTAARGGAVITRKGLLGWSSHFLLLWTTQGSGCRICWGESDPGKKKIGQIWPTCQSCPHACIVVHLDCYRRTDELPPWLGHKFLHCKKLFYFHLFPLLGYHVDPCARRLLIRSPLRNVLFVPKALTTIHGRWQHYLVASKVYVGYAYAVIPKALLMTHGQTWTVHFPVTRICLVWFRRLPGFSRKCLH